MASNKTQLMAQFYEQCRKQKYTNMHDEKQSLKAKVIATDLGLRYGNIIEFYEKAAQCYQQVQKEKAEEAERLRVQKQEERAEEARRAVNGTLLVTMAESGTALKVYLRPDGTTYCTVNDGRRIEGIPSVTVNKGGTLLYTYHPSETVFTGASVGGIMMGGTHQTEAYYTERVAKSEKGLVKASIGGTEVSVIWITMSDYTQERFKRDAQFKALVKNGRIKCLQDSEIADSIINSALRGSGDVYNRLSRLTIAADEKRLPYETCKEIANLLGRVIYGNFPPTDAEFYEHAKELANADSSKELLRAIETFRKIADYRDAAHQIDRVQKKYEAVLQSEKEQAILVKEANQKRNRKIAMILGPVICAAIAAVLLFTLVIIPNNKYNAAAALAESGETVKAMFEFGKLGGYKDARERSFALWDKVLARESIYADDDTTMALKTDGTVMATGFNQAGELNVSDWTDIVAISTSEFYTVGLKADGTVVIVGADFQLEELTELSDWTDIVAISGSSFSHTNYIVGLKTDGTVVFAGDIYYSQSELSDWTDIVAIHAAGRRTVGLKADGTVVVAGDKGNGIYKVSDWTDIVAISADYDHTVGLRADGTVVAVGDNDDGQCDVSDWTDIVAISTDYGHTVGLKADGTVVAVGDNDDGQCDVSGWTDIIAVIAKGRRTMGLKADGTVVAIGDNTRDVCNVSDWTNIVAISADSYHTVGLRADGTVVAVGYDWDDRCNVSHWTDIKLPD